MNAPVKLPITVSQVDFSDAQMLERVEGFAREHKASLFHRPAWLKAVEAGTGQKACGFVTQQMGVITGWLPLTDAHSALFGRAMVSSGFGVGGGILAETQEATQALAGAAQYHAIRNSVASVELRGGVVPNGWNGVSDKHAGFIAELAEDDEAQLLAIPRKARAEVRKGLKGELDIRIGRSDSDLAAHYAVYSESVRNLGTPVFPKALFKAMIEGFPSSADILTVYSGDEPVSSVLSFYHEGAVMPFWGGGTFAARSLRANELMYYKLMCHSRSLGMSHFDFGRSKTGSGPYNFKKNWGFEPAPLTYAHWHAPGVEPRDVDPTSEAYSRKIELWKKLPLPLANAIGPWIARGLA